ncbi:MAG TPA: hypothetical protein ENL06_00555 [Candidatus Portnoybacteria bacterium]|nr:hypothetical protein [Candidatus Portnoybacteria bacterium]
MINNYQFGLIIINNKKYLNDVEIRWSGEILPWIREKSHIFNISDIQGAIKENPEMIVFGTGAYGVANITSETLKLIEEQGIKVKVEKTSQAVKLFNNYLKKGIKVVGLFHLTC